VACLLSYFLYCASWRKHFFLCHNLINLNNVPLRVPMCTLTEHCSRAVDSTLSSAESYTCIP
jgi:hypothetical protein